ncbi:Fic family protein [Candidatus Endomicrobiellum trichonymphae]|uniref:Fic family protein n=1 Tax=Endomicrobium trichonymphae TaxID=1408204 RepID=UPI000BAA5E0D|nr:Fic family protein [Candidatus Endomicrobium trichonymphae]
MKTKYCACVPILVAVTHYKFVTTHPYYNGSGRTARILTTLVLHKYGYELKGIYNLEEYYAKDLQRYYKAVDNRMLS